MITFQVQLGLRTYIAYIPVYYLYPINDPILRSMHEAGEASMDSAAAWALLSDGLIIGWIEEILSQLGMLYIYTGLFYMVQEFPHPQYGFQG